MYSHVVIIVIIIKITNVRVCGTRRARRGHRRRQILYLIRMILPMSWMSGHGYASYSVEPRGAYYTVYYYYIMYDRVGIVRTSRDYCSARVTYTLSMMFVLATAV